jgi:hypothetical protein
VDHRATPIHALSIHADYACRHSGACCTAGWTIPVERHRRRLLGGSRLAPGDDGACRLYDRDTGLCRVHNEHGAEMMPASCQQFPRRALVDDRGVFVTLSHFCPTAAGLLFRADVPFAIVDEPPAFPASRGYEGLDGRGAWPPLVRPALLFDLPSYSRWERFVIETLARDATVRDAVARIAAAAERIRSWTPAAGEMETFVGSGTQVPDGPPDEQVMMLYHRFDRPDAYDGVLATVPRGLARPSPLRDAARSWERIAPDWDTWSTPIRRYLGSKAFASWSAYQARGIRTMVA